MTNVPAGVANTCLDSNQSPAARRYYGSPSRRHHDSCSDVSYSERPLLQSAQGTPCRRHYNACQTEAYWNGRDDVPPAYVRTPVVHRVLSASTTAQQQQQQPTPPTPAADNDEKVDTASFDGCGVMRFRCTAQMVDVMSRILFPCMFLIFNILYWPYYLFFCAP